MSEKTCERCAQPIEPESDDVQMCLTCRQLQGAMAHLKHAYTWMSAIHEHGWSASVAQLCVDINTMALERLNEALVMLAAVTGEEWNADDDGLRRVTLNDGCVVLVDADDPVSDQGLRDAMEEYHHE